MGKAFSGSDEEKLQRKRKQEIPGVFMKQQIDFDLERAISAEVRLLHFLCWVLYIFSLHNATGWEQKVPQEGKKESYSSWVTCPKFLLVHPWSQS